MVHRSNMPRVAGLALAIAAAVPLGTMPASAQEAIMLETIGAVRMAPPAEAMRMPDRPAPSRQVDQTEPRQIAFDRARRHQVDAAE